ncbi:hypothetical protein ACVWY2_000343 [Bradyrhizobium sp. JR6.1]
MMSCHTHSTINHGGELSKKAAVAPARCNSDHLEQWVPAFAGTTPRARREPYVRVLAA